MDAEYRSLNIIIGQINGVYHEAAVKMGISDSVLEIFYGILIYGDGCNQSVLYKNSGMGKTTVNSAIRRMEKERLLYLKAGEGRNTRVYLTEAGRELSEKTAGRLMEMEESVVLSWPEEDRRSFVSLMGRYLDQFSGKIRGGTDII